MNTIQQLQQEVEIHPTVYEEDRRRRLLLQVAVIELKELQQAIDEAAHIISSVGTTGIHDKVKDAQQWLKKYT